MFFKRSLSKGEADNYRRKVFNYAKNRLQNATTHGLSYIVNDRIHPFERIFWTFSFLTALALIFILLTAQFSRFIEAPTVISVDMDYFDWNISFPAITLCPLYKTIIPKFQEYLRKIENETGIKGDEYLWPITQANFESLDYIALDVSEESDMLFKPNEYAKIAAKLFRGFDAEVRTKTNQNISIVTAMTEMGLCHVLNSNVAIFDDPNNWNVSNINYEKKNIELSIYDQDFFLEISNYAKYYKVYIHSPDEIITGTTSTFNIDIDALISFGLSVWTTRISDELRALPLRIRKCRFLEETISDRYPIYSYSHCLLECRINMIKTLCGCIPHFYRPLAHETICKIRQLKCIVRYRKEILMLASSAKTEKFKDQLPSNSRDCGCLSTCELDQYHKDREDFSPATSNILEIGITSFPKVRVVRNIIFNIYDIILRSGGVINLCVGSSVISLMEIFVTFIKTIFVIIF